MFSQKQAKLTASIVVTAAAMAAWGTVRFSGLALADHNSHHDPPGNGGGDGEDDTIPPDAVSDLVGESAALGSIRLTWTAVGDDGGGVDCEGAGTAGLYDIRYATTPIVTDDDFEAATPVEGEPAPAPCGYLQTFCLGGLEPSVVYDVAVKVHDEAGNVSGLSNVSMAAAGAELGAFMHVDQILAGAIVAQGWNRNRRAWVTILDENGFPVEGAIVTGDWSGCGTGTDSAVTDCTGVATIRGGKVNCGPQNPCDNVFTVTDVTHDVAQYDPDANVQTSGSSYCY